MSMMKADMDSTRIAELEAIADEQARIDRVAEDLSTGHYRYAVIDAWKLGALLGVHFEDAGDGSWSHSCYDYQVKPEDGGATFPFAENVDLLDGKVSEERYLELAKLAEALTANEGGADLALSEEEEAMLRDAYQRQHSVGGSATVAHMSVHSTAGVELCFEGTLSDGYPDGGAWSPYELAKGGGFSTSGLVRADD